MPLKNYFSANSVEPGDIFLAVVKVVVQYDRSYRVYRCPWERVHPSNLVLDWSEEEDIPQGDRMFNAAYFDMIGTEGEDIEPFGDVEITARTLMPILGWTNSELDQR